MRFLAASLLLTTLVPAQAGPPLEVKGADLQLLEWIRELAERIEVFRDRTFESKPLAGALYRIAQVGQEIPTALYHAVAEVLAYVSRLRPAA